MHLGIIGRGYWGDVYARTLLEMGISHWQAGRDWASMPPCDGVIVASSPASHYDLAVSIINAGTPLLLEKPVSLTTDEADDLVTIAEAQKSIVFTGHTRLFSPAWQSFKKSLPPVLMRVYGAAGGGNMKLSPWWDWGGHLVSMYLDLLRSGIKIERFSCATKSECVPLSFDADGRVFTDVPTTPMPLNCLIGAFVAAIGRGREDIAGLRLGRDVVRLLQSMEATHGA